MSKTDVILQAEGLTYTYEGGDSPALQDLSLSVERGKRIALMGANGKRKNPLFFCAAQGFAGLRKGNCFLTEKRFPMTGKACCI